MSDITKEEQAQFDYLKSKREALTLKGVNFKALIYGDSGAGKTVAAMQLAQAITSEGKTIEFIDFLEGWASILNHPGLTERSSRQQYEGMSQISVLGKAIKYGIEPFDKVGTVVIDELSAMTKSDLDIVLKARAANDSSKDPNVPTQPDFYSNTERSRRTVTEILQADVNVIFVAHQREDKLSNGRVVIRPAFMPAFSELFRQMLHLVTHLECNEFINDEGTTKYNRAFQVHPTQSVSAKTRVGGLAVNVPIDVLIPKSIQWMRGEGKDEELTVEGENVEVKPDTNVVIEETDDVSILVD